MPQPSNILGYMNVTETLTTHKIYNNNNKNLKRSPTPGPGPSPDPTTIPPNSGSSNSDSTAFDFVNFLQIFNDTNNESGNDEDVKSCNDSSGIGGADDEEDDDEEDDECDGRSSARVSRKPGERYAGIHFEFLKEEWLEPDNESLKESSDAEEFSSSSD